LTATFHSADPNYSSDGVITMAIDVARTTPTVTAAGGTFTYDGQAHPATGSVTGAGGVSLGTPSLTYNGSAQPPVASGSYAVVASFAGNANYAPASAPATITIGKASLSIRANDSAKPFGAPLPLFTASAAGFVNGETFASLGGALTFGTTASAQSPVGTYPVVPSGLSSPNYVITFVPGTLEVVRGGVTVSVSASPAPSGLNQPMTFTATVSAAAPAAGAPAGTVRFFDGATLLGSRTLASGAASLTTAGLAAGAHTIQATYDGDASFAPGAGSASHTVNSASATPSITIASNRNPSSAGQSVTLTATLSMTTGPVTGTVQFYDGATLVGTATIASGAATFTTTTLAAGSHAMTVRYPGSASAPPVISGVFVQAVGSAAWKNRTSSTTLSASPNPSAMGAAVTLTASVTGPNGTPAGAVLFMVNGQVVGGPVTLTAVSGSLAQATFVVPGLAGGRHVVTATYLGSSNYKGSTAAFTQAVN